MHIKERERPDRRRLIPAFRAMHDEGALDLKPRERIGDELRGLKLNAPIRCRGGSAGFTSGPRILKIVRTPSAARTGASAFIAGW